MSNNYDQKIQISKKAIRDAEFILIGGGSGLSAAAGLTYSGKRFTDNFADFIEKYGVKDMYSASFYPFETQEELWAHWARHIDVNRFSQGPTPLYQDLLKFVQNKKYFVITTNVESQFEKAGFPREKIFEVQGNYAYLQCAKACTKKLYYDEPIIKQMLAETRDCRIPSALVPKCPVCGGPMDVNLRHDEYFVQDEVWYTSNERYGQFLEKVQNGRIIFWELGVGFNTPGIIRYPFESMTYRNPNSKLIRINRDYPLGVKENLQRIISFDEDMGQTITELM
jgi:NAD-dependent SIR2 family protein deacetylase